MCRNSTRPSRAFRFACTTLAATLAVAVAPANGATISLGLQLSRQHETFYSCFPSLSYFDPVIPPPSVPVEVRSGNGMHSGILGVSSSTALFYPSYEELLVGASNPDGDPNPWTLTFDPNGASPTVYTFGVDLRSLGTPENPAELPLVEVFEPQWSGGDGLSPLFTWSGPSDFESLSVNLYDTAFNYVDGVTLSPDATSWTPGVSLAPMSGFFVSVHYSRSENTGTAIVGTPAQGETLLPYDWVASVSLATSSSRNFETGAAVPEPQWAAVGTGLALAGFAWFRRRRRASGSPDASRRREVMHRR